MSEIQTIQMQQETNKIISDIESQKLDSSGTAAFIYALFAIVAISMAFENFVRNYRKQKHDKKKAGEPIGEYRKKLLIAYGIHIVVVLLFWVICKFALKLTTPYIGFLIALTVYIVEISPLFAIYIKFKKEEEKNDSAQ